MSLEMFKNYLMMQSGSVRYGTDIDVSKYLKGKKINMNLSSNVVDSDLINEQLENDKCHVSVNKPHEFSSSLAKLLCLSEEYFSTDADCKADLMPYPIEVQADLTKN